MSVEEEVLKEIKPKPEEEEKLKSIYRMVREASESVLRERRIDAVVSLQGSVAKGTWISGDVDLDVFILFPKNLGGKWIREKALEILVSIAEHGGWEFQARYAEHPYITMIIEGVKVDLVPALRLESPLEAGTAVDRTPFHTEYVAARLSDELRDQVRLLKKFMKGVGVYGAEIRVGGFSGYLSELLVIRYGSFRGVLEASSEWRRPVRILVEEDIDVPWDLWSSPMIVPDPVDPRRNAAAAVTNRRLGEFTWASKLYLAGPSRMFFEGGWSKPMLQGDVVVVEVEGIPSLPPDILWGELGRTARRLTSILSNAGFRVADISLWSDEHGRAAWCVELESAILPEMELVVGPPFDDFRASQGFVKAYTDRRMPVWIDEKGRLRAFKPRKHRNALEVLTSLSGEYLVAPHLRGLKPRVRLAGRGEAPCRKDSFLSGYTSSGGMGPA